MKTIDSDKLCFKRNYLKFFSVSLLMIIESLRNLMKNLIFTVISLNLNTKFYKIMNL